MTSLEVVHFLWVAVLVGLPVIIAGSRMLGVRRVGTLALLQDSCPVVLGLVWIALAVAVAMRAWNIAVVAGVVATYHVCLVVSLLRARPVPDWVGTAPTTTLAVANIYVDNDELEAASRQLLSKCADHLVVLESNPEFRRVFDEVGGLSMYPFRTFDAEDRSDYASSMYSRREPLSIRMITIGELSAAQAIVDVSGLQLQILGVIPSAAVESGGYELWHRQMESLVRYARRSSIPLVVAGDLNTTIHRVAYNDIRQAGLDDAHDDLGFGLRPSFKLAAKGLLSKLGPLVRLDHALTNRWVWATDVEDLDPIGSDHRPFVVTLAVKAAGTGRGHRRARSLYGKEGAKFT